MKLLNIHFGKEGGAERFFVNLATAFGERGVEQHFIIRPNRSWGGVCRGLGPVWYNNYRYMSLTSPILEFRTRRLIRSWKPDAVIAWMPRAARLIPAIEGPFRMTRLGDFPANLKHFGNCDALVGNTPAIVRRCRELGWERPAYTISNFAREVTPQPVRRADYDTPEDAFLISSAGRFVPRKGMDFLVRAAAQVPDAWLWLIGDGRERDALENLVAELGMAERTRFIGWVDEPIHYIAASDVFAMPSRHEPLGNVVLEAWQARKPVVAAKSEGPRWYGRHDQNAFLTEIDDLEHFVEGLKKVQQEPEYARQLVAGGTATLEANFSKQGVVDRYLELMTNHKLSDGDGLSL